MTLCLRWPKSWQCASAKRRTQRSSLICRLIGLLHSSMVSIIEKHPSVIERRNANEDCVDERLGNNFSSDNFSSDSIVPAPDHVSLRRRAENRFEGEPSTETTLVRRTSDGLGELLCGLKRASFAVLLRRETGVPGSLSRSVVGSCNSACARALCNWLSKSRGPLSNPKP